jgi:hypothetical protein
MSINTPTNPTSNPIITPGRGRNAPCHSQSKSTIHIGTVETRSAVMLDETCCSAHVTPPFPTKSNNVPMIAADRHSILVGGFAPRKRAQPYKRRPAIMNRVPAIMNGGMVSTPKRIARYVDPQTTYIAANAATKRDFEGSSFIARSKDFVLDE